MDPGCHKLIDSTKEDICEKSFSNHVVLIKEPMNFENSRLACDAIGGEMFLPKNDSELDLLANLIKPSKICEGAAFLGATKTINEEILGLNSLVEPFSKWGKNQPNGRHISKCISLDSFDGTDYVYNDVQCNFRLCFACNMKVKKSFFVSRSESFDRGL